MKAIPFAGRICDIIPPEAKGSSNYVSGAVVVEEENETKPQKFMIEFGGDAGLDVLAELMNLGIGARVEVMANIRGREYDKRDGSGKGYFTSLAGWKFKSLDAPQQAPPAQQQSYKPAPAPIEDAPDDGLPF